MTGEYLHFCVRCGGEFYSDEWYLGARCECPECEGAQRRLRPSDAALRMSEDALRRAEDVAARKAREARDREYAANPPKTTVTVENGIRVERRGTVPVGANAGGGLFKPDN